MRERPKPQEIYRHFKGNLYQIVTIALDSETKEELVVYQALYGDFRVWCRELTQFLSEVDHGKYPEVSAKYRFTRVEAVPVTKGGRPEEDRTGRPSMIQQPDPTLLRSDSVAEIPVTSARMGVMAKTIEEEAQELNMDPLVVAFLDADGASARIRVLEELRGRVNDEMIDIMAMAAGLEVEPGEPWQRYNELMSSLRTIERFETSRLRD